MSNSFLFIKVTHFSTVQCCNKITLWMFLKYKRFHKLGKRLLGFISMIYQFAMILHYIILFSSIVFRFYFTAGCLAPRYAIAISHNRPKYQIGKYIYHDSPWARYAPRASSRRYLWLVLENIFLKLSYSFMLHLFMKLTYFKRILSE